MARVSHYAYLGDVYGTAELLCGSGYLFRAEGERQATLVSYKDPELMLLGLVPTADDQALEDELRGGAAWICTHRAQGVA
jgi:hypothetical protein